MLAHTPNILTVFLPSFITRTESVTSIRPDAPMLLLPYPSPQPTTVLLLSHQAFCLWAKSNDTMNKENILWLTVPNGPSFNKRKGCHSKALRTLAKAITKQQTTAWPLRAHTDLPRSLAYCRCPFTLPPPTRSESRKATSPAVNWQILLLRDCSATAQLGMKTSTAGTDQRSV